MSVEDRLKNYNRKIDQTKLDLVSWAMGVKAQRTGGFWARNYLNFVFYAVFTLMALAFYWSGLQIFAFILALVILMKLGEDIWTALTIRSRR